MLRVALVVWVLLSIPLCVALGRMLGEASTPTPCGDWGGRQVARMVSRSGYRSP